MNKPYLVFLSKEEVMQLVCKEAQKAAEEVTRFNPESVQDTYSVIDAQIERLFTLKSLLTDIAKRESIDLG